MNESSFVFALGNDAVPKFHAGILKTLSFIQQVAKPGQTVLDVGCGNGIFLVYPTDVQLDIVLLSRSLHHITTTELVVEQTFLLLKNGGWLLVEEFGAELMDRHSAIWFYGLKHTLLAGAHHPARVDQS